MSKVITCKGRRVNDQMMCDKCSLQWDVNDDPPPSCKAASAGQSAMDEIRQAREVSSRKLELPLLYLKQVPFNLLPAFGVQAGLRMVDWTSHPALRWCAISRVGKSECPSVHYVFYGHTGEPLIEVVRVEDYASARTALRHYADGKPGEWR